MLESVLGTLTIKIRKGDKLVSLLESLIFPRTMRAKFLLAITSCTILAFGLFWATIAFGCYERNPWYRIYLSSGTSMKPVIVPDEVLIILSQTEGLEPGMIVSFPSPYGPDFILHRIVAITEEGCYLTKGDNNPYIDDWQVCEVKGRYVGKIPYLGKAIKPLRESSSPRTE